MNTELILEGDDLLRACWFQDPKKNYSEAEHVFLESAEKIKNAMRDAGAKILSEMPKDMFKEKPVRIVGSGPTHSETTSIYEYVESVIGCNAAPMENPSRYHYGVTGDPSMSLAILKDTSLSVPYFFRMDEVRTEEAVKAIKRIRRRRKYVTPILVDEPLDSVQITMHNGDQFISKARMTGTVAIIVACYFSSPIITLSGIDYVPYSSTKMSRYDVTPWYTPPPTQDENTVMFRGYEIPAHWEIEVHTTEYLAKLYYNMGLGSIMLAKRAGVLNLPSWR